MGCGWALPCAFFYVPYAVHMVLLGLTVCLFCVPFLCVMYVCYVCAVHCGAHQLRLEFMRSPPAFSCPAAKPVVC
jgi:hypothetical protein